MWLVPCPEQREGLVRHAHEELGPFWGLTDLWFTLGTVLVAWDATIGSTICLLVCGV